MEWVPTKVTCIKDLKSKDISYCHLFGCPFHQIALAIDQTGKVYSNDQDYINLQFTEPILQIVVSCNKDPEKCYFYFRSITNQVFEWILDKSDEPLKKRVKLDDSVSHKIEQPYRKIASDVSHIMAYNKPGVILLLETKAKHYNPNTSSFSSISTFYPSDSKMTCHQYFNRLDNCFIDFFSLSSIKNGLIFGTKDGSVYCRDLNKEPIQDTRLMAFDNLEQVIYLELLTLYTLIAISNRGTVMIYSKVTNHLTETNMTLKQFNIQGPIHAIEKSNENFKYFVSSGNGKISMLEFKYTANDDIEIESTHVQNHGYFVKQLRITSDVENKLDSLSNQQDRNVQFKTYEFQSTPISIKNNAEAITQLTKEALKDLNQSELDLKDLDTQEQNLSKKLVSTNRTLYALQSIYNKKRKSGTCHSFESTGFELTMRPVTIPQSIANSSLHSSCYLRICIKTSRFLELENWNLELDLFPYKQCVSVIGETKIIPVIGFETKYQNGLERYSAWERDVQLDLDKLKLPLKVSVCLSMSIEENQPSIRFPISNMIIDDIHFTIPCHPDFITSFHRRGLDEVSNKLMSAYQKQMLYDKTGKYPFSRLLSSKKASNDMMLFSKSLFDYKNVHIKCLIDVHTTDQMYRSILSNILNEGKTMDEMKGILVSAEQAVFTLAAYPGCPVIIELSRVSSTLIDFYIQCVYTPALFKVEATFICRLLDHFIKIPTSDKNEDLKYAAFFKKMKSLEESILKLQQNYQDSNQFVINELKNSIDILFEIYNEKPIGQFVSTSIGN